MSTPTPEDPGPATLSPVEREEALLEIGTTLGFFASCIKSGDHWSPTCQDARDKAWAALARLRAPVAPESGLPPEELSEETRKALEGEGEQYVAQVEAFDRRFAAIPKPAPAPVDTVLVSREWLEHIAPTLRKYGTLYAIAEIDRLLEGARG